MGYAINHLHIQFVPIHLIDNPEWKPVNGADRSF
jgi:hypothetical protein